MNNQIITYTINVSGGVNNLHVAEFNNVSATSKVSKETAINNLKKQLKNRGVIL